MSDYNAARVFYYGGKNPLKHKQKLMAYFQLHLDNPGLHPDDSLDTTGGYQGWHVLLTRDVIDGPTLQDNVLYPSWLYNLSYVIHSLEDFHFDDDDMLEVIKRLKDSLIGLDYNSLDKIICDLDSVLIFHTDGPEGIIESLYDARNAFIWVNELTG